MTTEKVEQEPVSTEEQVSQEAEKVEATTEQPLTEERVLQLIAKRESQAREAGRREMQGIKDREVAEVKRRADLAERRSNYDFSNLDEDTRSQLEFQRMRGENEYYKGREQEEEGRRQQEAYFASLENLKSEHLKRYKIDPSDSRIDLGNSQDDFISGWNKFDASVNRIVESEREKLEKTAVEKAEERFKQLEADFRKEHGLDSQDTTSATGVVNQSDADFMAGWGAYELPDTKENRERYEKIKQKYY